MVGRTPKDFAVFAVELVHCLQDWPPTNWVSILRICNNVPDIVEGTTLHMDEVPFLPRLPPWDLSIQFLCPKTWQNSKENVIFSIHRIYSMCIQPQIH